MTGAGVFYHYVIFIPSVENAKQAQLEIDKKDAERRAVEKSKQYEFCKTTARLTYEADWGAACKAVAETRKQQYENCLKNQMVLSNQFLGKQYCVSNYGTSDSSANCSLPNSYAKTINDSLKDAETKCLLESKNGL